MIRDLLWTLGQWIKGSFRLLRGCILLLAILPAALMGFMLVLLLAYIVAKGG